ncbi:MAG: L,D-transpeptidase family protein [Ruminococcus sp.]|nr:L,D-transpeptidase family protein [Ruminococcus sp.]
MSDMPAPTAQLSSEELAARRIMETMRENERSERPSGKKKSSGQPPKKKKKKQMSGVKAIVIAVIIIVVLVLGFLAFLYFRGLREAQGKFLQNTTINGVNVSGMNESEAYNALMKDSAAPDSITLIKVDGSKTVLPLKDIGYQDNVKVFISQYMTQQNYYLWFTNLSGNTEYHFDTTFTYDKTLLAAELKRRVVDTSGKVEPRDAYIRYTGSGFEIVKEQKGDKIDDSKIDGLIEFVEEQLKQGLYKIDLSSCDLYQSPKIVAADLEDQLAGFENLEDVILGFDFIYETAYLSGSEFMSWIEFKDNNALNGISVNRDKAMAFVEKLAAKYDTYKTKRKFHSTNKGDMILDQGEGCYGWWIDQERMCDLIISEIKKGESNENIKPIYYKSPYSSYEYSCDPKYRTATTDLGNTYCEVDLEKQHFWYYLDGELKYECDVVTGFPNEERETPPGIYKLWLKETDKTLTGSISTGSWSSHVNYWNNISTFGIGLHDTVRRKAFGGTIYKVDGSHGCINMPLKAAKYVYENVAINTPVIIY